ncbi:MAG: glycoside hydrolase family 97 C-terminal domain-containing protein [Spirosomataceae bacterium]
MHFLSNVSTVCSETVPLTNRVGDYVTVALKNGSKWWLGAMTDWTATEYDIKLTFWTMIQNTKWNLLLTGQIPNVTAEITNAKYHV